MANTQPNFVSAPNANPISISVSNTAHRASGNSTNMVSLISGGTNGTRVEGVIFTALESTTSGCIQIYESGSSNPSVGALYIVGEVTIFGGTSSSTTIGFTSTWVPTVTTYTLKSGYYLWYSVTVNKKFSAKPISADY